MVRRNVMGALIASGPVIIIAASFTNAAYERLSLDEDGVGRAKSNEIRYNSSAVDAAVWDQKFQVAEFAKGAAEMSVEFGEGMRDVVNQTVLREDYVIMKKLLGIEVFE